MPTYIYTKSVSRYCCTYTQGSREPIMKEQQVIIGSRFLFVPTELQNKRYLESQGYTNESQMKQKENGFHPLEDVEKDLTDDFGNWEVKDDGEIIYHGTVIGTKSIPSQNLICENITHMLSKHWGEHSKDAVDYYFAYLRALQNAGYKSLTINLTNIHNFKLEK